MSEETNDLKLLNILPFFGSFLIFLGATRLFVFYQYFGINIINFIEFSEIITSFLDIIILAIIIMSFAIVNKTINNIDEIEDHNTKKDRWDIIIQTHDAASRLWLYIKHLWITISTLGFLLIVTIVYSYIKNDIEQLYFNLILAGSTLIFLLVSLEFQYKHVKKQRNRTQIQLYNFLLYFLLSITLLMIFTHTEIKLIKTRKSYQNTTILLTENRILKSDNENYYIGNTNGYLFFHHSLEKITDVYPMAEVKQIKFNSSK